MSGGRPWSESRPKERRREVKEGERGWKEVVGSTRSNCKIRTKIPNVTSSQSSVPHELSSQRMKMTSVGQGTMGEPQRDGGARW